MHGRWRRPISLMAVLWLALATACDDDGCGMEAAPLERDLTSADKVYDGIQLEVSPEGLELLQANFDKLAEAVTEEGLVFDLPPDPGGCGGGVEARVCNRTEPCPIDIELKNVVLRRRGPNVIVFQADMDAVTGRIPVRACSPVNTTCNARIHISGKPVSAEVAFESAAVTHGLTFTVTKLPEIEIESRDYSISGGVLCSLAGLFKSQITDMVNDMLGDQLVTEIEEMVDETTCMKCDFFSLGCLEGLHAAPYTVSCDAATDRCVLRDGRCVRAPFGVVGTLDLGALVAGPEDPKTSQQNMSRPSRQMRGLGTQGEGDEPEESALSFDVHFSVGQLAPTRRDPIIPYNDGPLRLRFIAGMAASVESGCVPPLVHKPSPRPTPRADFEKEADGLDYHLALGITELFLNKALYEVYRTGALCLSLDEEIGDMLTSGLFAAFLPSLGVLTDGKNTPMSVRVRPKSPPEVHIGKGTWHTDGENLVIDEPLIILNLKRFLLDFYAFLEGRQFRVFTLDLDLAIPLGLRLSDEGALIPVLGSLDSIVTRVTTKNNAILAEDPSVLEQIIPLITGMLEPMLDELLQPIDIPEFEGFDVAVDRMEGIHPHPSPGRYEHIGLFLRLLPE